GMLEDAMSKLELVGLLLAAKDMPTAPAAPVLFTTTTGFLSTFSKAAATGLAVRSATPPGGKGAAMVIGRSGYFSCPEALTVAKSKIVSANKKEHGRDGRIAHLR